MPGVLMLETLDAGGGGAADRPRRPDVDVAGVSPRCRCGQIPQAGRSRRSVAAGSDACEGARARWPKRVRSRFVGDQVVAEADLLLAIVPDAVRIHPSAVVMSGAQIGAGTTIGPNSVIGPHVKLGKGCRIGASAVVDGFTEIGDGTEIFPFASIGLIPQDLKFKGEETSLRIGKRNIFREFVTIHRGTRGGGGQTTIGDRNVFMAYAHIAHDCHIGNDTIFGNNATLGGHVFVDDFATISAGSGVHQFCRIGRHAFIGGYSVVTKDALPVREDRRKPGAHLRPEYGRPDAPRVHRRNRRQAQASLPISSAVAPEHHARPQADRAGREPSRVRRSSTWSTSFAPRSAGRFCAGRPGEPKRWWRMSNRPSSIVHRPSSSVADDGRWTIDDRRLCV